MPAGTCTCRRVDVATYKVGHAISAEDKRNKEENKVPNECKENRVEQEPDVKNLCAEVLVAYVVESAVAGAHTGFLRNSVENVNYFTQTNEIALPLVLCAKVNATSERSSKHRNIFIFFAN
jgi:hypothetical protein